MSKRIEKVMQEILAFGERLDLRNRLFKRYQKSCYDVMNWILLSRESKITIIEDMKASAIKEGAHVFQACLANRTSSFYVDHIDAIIEYADTEKVELQAVEEGIPIMILCVALVEEIGDNKDVAVVLKERLKKEGKYGIDFERCFEEILYIAERLPTSKKRLQ